MSNYLYSLGHAIEGYLNSIVSLSPRRLPINSSTLEMLRQRVKNAFVYELGSTDFDLQPDNNRNLVITFLEKGE